MRPFCNYGVSFCFVVFGAWGFVQLAIMSLLYKMHCVSLMHDIPQKHHYDSARQYYEGIEHGYAQNTISCLIASIVYLIILLMAFVAFVMNKIEEAEKENRKHKPKNVSRSTTEYNLRYGYMQASGGELRPTNVNRYRVYRPSQEPKVSGLSIALLGLKGKTEGPIVLAIDKKDAVIQAPSSEAVPLQEHSSIVIGRDDADADAGGVSSSLSGDVTKTEPNVARTVSNDQQMPQASGGSITGVQASGGSITRVQASGGSITRVQASQEATGSNENPTIK